MSKECAGHKFGDGESVQVVEEVILNSLHKQTDVDDPDAQSYVPYGEFGHVRQQGLEEGQDGNFTDPYYYVKLNNDGIIYVSEDSLNSVAQRVSPQP